MYVQNRNRPTDIDNKLMVIKRKRHRGVDNLGIWDQHMYMTIYKTGNPQGPIAQGIILNIL